MKYALVRWVLFLCIGVGIGLAIVSLKTQHEMESEIEQEEEITSLGGDKNLNSPAGTVIKPQAPVAEEDHFIPGAQFGGTYSLTDQNGQTVTEKSFPGMYKLVFFGFTYCPAVCPTELQKITQVIHDLGDLGLKIQPVFVSVDPDRDTVAVIKKYLQPFDSRFVGLTGSEDQVAAAKNAYKVYANKVAMPGTEDYMVDHSAFTYFMGPENELIAIYPATDKIPEITADIKKHLSD